MYIVQDRRCLLSDEKGESLGAVNYKVRTPWHQVLLREKELKMAEYVILFYPNCRWAGEKGIGLWGLEWSSAGERWRLRLLSASGIFQYFHSFMYHIVSFVYRSLDTNVKAAVVGARVGQGEGRGGGGKVGQGGQDGSASSPRTSLWTR